jgi:hypothetical protein
MNDEEVRAWSLLIVSILNEYKCDSVDTLLCKNKLIEGIEDYIRNGKKENKPLEGIHSLEKKIYDVNIKNKEIIC